MKHSVHHVSIEPGFKLVLRNAVIAWIVQFLLDGGVTNQPPAL
jgi:hypothetical protein